MNVETHRLVVTRTNKIHSAHRGSYNATPCNSRNSGFRVMNIGATQAKRADASMYCSKCFPSGKPTDEEIDRAAR